MSESLQVYELLLNWRMRRYQGEDITPEALCAGCPELLEPLRQRIQEVDSFEEFLGVASSAVDEPSTRSQPTQIRRLGPYEVITILGMGGMGMVLRAEDPVLHRQVAIKVMKPELAADPRARERFLREARAAARVSHDHVVTIHHVGEEGIIPFLVMPLLEGETLAQRLTRGAPLPVPRILSIGFQIARGLAAAHEKGLIHRDLKPANIWLEQQVEVATPVKEVGDTQANPTPAPRTTSHDRVKIIDFGLAMAVADKGVLTHSGVVMGTPAYMAPEQARGEAVDFRADLFSLGCVLYEMATGKRPFDGDTPLVIMFQLTSRHPPPPQEINPDLPTGLCDLIQRLLSKEPGERPPSAAAVAGTLESLAGNHRTPQETLRVPPGAAATPGTADRQGTKWLWIIPALGLLLLAGLVAPLWRSPRQAAEPPGQEAAPFRGQVDVRVFAKADGDRHDLGLRDPGALPLAPGDLFRVEAEVEPPGFVYLFWIDTEGKAEPLYPWKPGKWGTRPAQEEKRTRLRLPENVSKGFPVRGAGEGMVTVVLLIRSQPLALEDGHLQQLLQGLPPQRPMPHTQAVAWFDNGELVREGRMRASNDWDEVAIDSPVLRIHGLLREKLLEHADALRAICFAKRGR